MIQRNRLFRISLVLFWLTGSFSCSSSNTQQAADTTNAYFSLEAFFTSEIDRLTALAPTLNKTVSRNGVSEKKEVQIENWENELALFIDSDINKPAWQKSYRIDSTERSVVYKSIDPELRTQKITIDKNENGLIKHIAISNHTSNMLYQTAEQLDYYPDSLYRINKQQQVRFIGNSRYTINASF